MSPRLPRLVVGASLALLLVSTPAAAQTCSKCGDISNECLSAKDCEGELPGTACKSSKRSPKNCSIVRYSPSGGACCCGCVVRGGPTEAVTTCRTTELTGQEVKHLKVVAACAGTKVQKATAVAVAKVERELKKEETACDKGNGAKEQQLVKAEERDLARLAAKVDASAQKGTTSPDCAAQIDAEIEAIVKEVTQADAEAPCPFSIVDAFINTFDAFSCSRVTSDPLGLTCSLPFNCSATFGLHGTIRLISPDPDARFSGRDCDASGVIDLSRARRPRCNLECTCQNPATTTTTSTTTTTIGGNCAAVGDACAILQPCCLLLDCENGKCCEMNGETCHDDPDCCAGLRCGPLLPDLRRVCEPRPSTTTTTLPCPCSLTGDPLTVTNPPVPPTPAAPNRVDYFLVGGAVPACIAHSGRSCLITYHVIDVGTGTDLANPAWPTPAGQIDWTEDASVGPHGEGALALVFYNYFGGSPDGETKQIYLVTNIKCPPPINPDDPHICE